MWPLFGASRRRGASSSDPRDRPRRRPEHDPGGRRDRVSRQQRPRRPPTRREGNRNARPEADRPPPEPAEAEERLPRVEAHTGWRFDHQQQRAGQRTGEVGQRAAIAAPARSTTAWRPDATLSRREHRGRLVAGTPAPPSSRRRPPSAASTRCGKERPGPARRRVPGGVRSSTSAARSAVAVSLDVDSVAGRRALPGRTRRHHAGREI